MTDRFDSKSSLPSIHEHLTVKRSPPGSFPSTACGSLAPRVRFLRLSGRIRIQTLSRSAAEMAEIRANPRCSLPPIPIDLSFGEWRVTAFAPRVSGTLVRHRQQT